MQNLHRLSQRFSIRLQLEISSLNIIQIHEIDVDQLDFWSLFLVGYTLLSSVFHFWPDLAGSPPIDVERSPTWQQYDQGFIPKVSSAFWVLGMGAPIILLSFGYWVFHIQTHQNFLGIGYWVSAHIIQVLVPTYKEENPPNHESTNINHGQQNPPPPLLRTWWLSFLPGSVVLRLVSYSTSHQLLFSTLPAILVNQYVTIPTLCSILSSHF